MQFYDFYQKQALFFEAGGVYVEFWIKPSGEVVRAQEGHYNWAMQTGLLRLSDADWDNRSLVYKEMGKHGYLRVTITSGIMFQKYFSVSGELFTITPNRAQKNALIDMGRQRELCVWAVGESLRGELIYDPADELHENVIVGITEPVHIDGIGSVEAKIDSGNDGCNVIHGVNITRAKDNEGNVIVKFLTIDDKTVSFRQDSWIEVVAGGSNQTRPVIKLNIKVKDKFFPGEQFSIADRSQNKEKILLGIPFIKKMGALVDVNKASIVENSNAEDIKRKVELYNYVKARLVQKVKDLDAEIKTREHTQEDYDLSSLSYIYKQMKEAMDMLADMEGKRPVLPGPEAEALFARMKQAIRPKEDR